MIMKKVKKEITFQELREYLASIHNINRGGCGISTWFMKKFDKDNNFLIVFGYKNYSKDELINNLEFERGNSKNVNSCPHIFLYYIKTKEFFDCEDIIDITEFKYFHFANENLLLNAIHNAEWNKAFDRIYYLPKIEKFTKIKLEKV